MVLLRLAVIIIAIYPYDSYRLSILGIVLHKYIHVVEFLKMTILFRSGVPSLTIKPTEQPDLPTCTSRTHETNLSIFQSSCYTSTMTFTRYIRQMNERDRFSTSSPTPTPTLLTPRSSTRRIHARPDWADFSTRNTTDTCIHVNEECSDIRNDICDARQKQIFIIMKGVKCECEILLTVGILVSTPRGTYL